MTTYLELKSRIADLERQAAALRQAKLPAVIAKIKTAIAEYGLTERDLGFGGVTTTTVAKKNVVEKSKKPLRKAKYRDQRGNTWVGRGKRPHWLRQALAQGKRLEDFAV